MWFLLWTVDQSSKQTSTPSFPNTIWIGSTFGEFDGLYVFLFLICWLIQFSFGWVYSWENTVVNYTLMSLRIYNEQNPKHPFKSLPSCEVLCYASEWEILYPSPGLLALSFSTSTASGDPVSCLNTLLSFPSDTSSTHPCPINVKQSKRKGVALVKDEAKDEDQK